MGRQIISRAKLEQYNNASNLVCFPIILLPMILHWSDLAKPPQPLTLQRPVLMGISKKHSQLKSANNKASCFVIAKKE
jgi:hypothetical protein